MLNKKTKVIYSGLQILRFVAASFVVIDHAILQVTLNWSAIPKLQKYAYLFGEVGVIVFFGISGFIMVTTRYESFGKLKSSIDFMLSRTIRILPIYAIATTLQYINKFRLGGDYNFINYIKSILFIPYISSENGLYRPILGQGWTLDYEMFFYLIFAISLSLPRTKGLFLSILVFLVLASFNDANIDYSIVLRFYTNHILLYFICGMLVGIVIKYHYNSINKLFYPMILVVLLMLITVILKPITDPTLYLCLSLIIVFICVYVCANCQPNRRGRFQTLLGRLGDASYSTYLFHGFFLGASKSLAHHIGDGQYVNVIVFVIFCIVGANLIGLFTYNFVELTVTGYVNKHYKKLKTGSKFLH